MPKQLISDIDPRNAGIPLELAVVIEIAYIYHYIQILILQITELKNMTQKMHGHKRCTAFLQVPIDALKMPQAVLCCLCMC